MQNNVVYLHRKLSDNSVFYVGIGKPTRPYCFKGRNNLWNKIYKKYGCSVDVVKRGLSRKEANECEKMLIAHFGKIKDNTGTLVNMTDGGDGIQRGHKHDESFKEKRRKVMLGNSITKGRKLSKEHKEKLSKAGKGRKAWNKGVSTPKEVIEKIKRNSKRLGDSVHSCRVFVDGVWFNSMKEAGDYVSNRTTTLNRCKSEKWNYYREGYDDPIPARALEKITKMRQNGK